MEPTIRALSVHDLAESMELVWRVFQEFEAPEYSKEGIDQFRRYIQPEEMWELMSMKGLKMWGAYIGEKLVGVIAESRRGHISLLFVDRDYHRQGIARRLFDEMTAPYRGHGVKLTVHASPYAHEIYKRLGFADTDVEQVEDGMRFWPMEQVV